jgi:predicted regulator of Ras-like GTPase activity (Roadblock/LC7/MglB family)
MTRTPYAELLAMLSRHRGVTGSFVVSERDGLAVDSNVQIGVHAEAVAAQSSSKLS